MKRASPSIAVLIGALLCLGVLGGEFWWLKQEQRKASSAIANLEQKKQERDWLARQSPALSSENESATEAEVLAAEAALKAARAAVQSRDDDLFAAPAPARPIDAFFEIANSIEQLRQRAGQAQVVLKPDERFGFAAYANEGPAVERIAAVHRQWLAARQVVEQLLESRPLALLAVRREQPGSEVSRSQPTSGEDYFAINHGLSLKRPGLIETEAFRVEFTGQTSTLRSFLGALGGNRPLTVVRSVEVEPLVAPSINAGRSSDASIPLVRQSLSKFAVTLEFVFLSPDPAPSAP